jgi:urea carboxylase/allophanate hydrolase
MSKLQADSHAILSDSVAPGHGRLVTISDWLQYQTSENGLEHLLHLVRTLNAAEHDTAWISLASEDLIRSQWENLLSLKSKTEGRLPLFAVPFAVKDNIDVVGLATTAACPDFAYQPTADAEVIRVLRSAGAILIGKTNLDQFATGLNGTRSPYGIVPNTFDKRYVSGGSSSGSASVVARGIVPFALGTDTAGSGRVPAGLNNIVGLKATRGALSVRGLVPACQTLDCISILTTTLEDAETVFSAVGTYDVEDPWSRAKPASVVSKVGSKPRIAICKDPEWYGQREHGEAYERALEKVESLGWDLVPMDFSNLFKLADLLYEGPWVAERFAAVKEFINRPDSSMDPVVRGIIEKAHNFSSVDLFEGKYLRRELSHDIELRFAEFDAILVPTTPTFPTIEDLAKEPVLENSRLGTYTNFVNFLDWTALSFPAGFREDELPFGLTIISTTWQEPKLLDLASRFVSAGPRKLACTEFTYQDMLMARDMEEPEKVNTISLAVVGAHRSGFPLNYQLTSIGGVLSSTTTTSPNYRMYELEPASVPAVRRPGLRRVQGSDAGIEIEVEVWEIPIETFGSFILAITRPLAIGSVELINGNWVSGFVCEQWGLENAKDISEYSSWPRYIEQSTTVVTPFTKVLIANRGEIAVRIAAALKKLNIYSVAIYSNEDRTSDHVKAADSCYILEGTSVAETYLSGSQILKIAKESGAQAIIPGYGFLSENAEFAESCEKEHIVWIGPTPSQMRTLGLKHLARELAKKSNVPLLPGSKILDSVDVALAEADRIGYPVMMKSTAGGGGIGLSKCTTPTEVKAAFASVKQQGQQFFKDDGIFLEHFVEGARHIEIQIIGDGSGNVRHAGTRDCSLQRRHQKVIEECPAPTVPPSIQTQMCDAAVRLVQEISYRGVGTVEFLYEPASRSFYFLEVNTRLQVEHPITEAVMGFDLVEAMIRIASNDAKSLFSEISSLKEDGEFSAPRVNGHAIEVRIYAENPLKAFQPSTGQILECFLPRENARIDTWIRAGSIISSSFDPLLAKLIVHGTDRADAVSKLATALEITRISGVETNLQYLRHIVAAEMFVQAGYKTTTLDSFIFHPGAFQVLEPGSLTTVQDFPGRRGLWHAGIPPSGPMDDYAFRVANQILGNDSAAAGLECTSQGPTLLFHCSTVIAVTGPETEVTIDGKPIKMYSGIQVLAGQQLAVGTPKTGYRTYIAISGGIQVPNVFNSRSTFALGHLGGHNGRALRADDILSIPPLPKNQFTSVPIRETAILPTSHTKVWTLHVLPGPHAFPDYFTPSSFASLLTEPWSVHYNSNRIGVRLSGPKPIWARTDGGEAGLHPSNIHDSSYSIGSISFTGDEAVILTCDGPSLGGFLVFATVVTCEMWKVGQMRPGDEVRLCPITASQATQLREAQDVAINTLFETPALSFESAITDPILGNIGSFDRSIVCRQAGDAALLLEFGENNFNLRTSFHIYWFMRQQVSLSSKEILEMTPGVRSLHIQYDPAITQTNIMSFLSALERSLGEYLPTTVPSRTLTLPLAIDHPSTIAAVQRYAQTIRPTAPWVPSNIDFLQKLNSLTRPELEAKLFNATFLVLGLGDVFFGAPCAVPLDPRHRLFGTKYNPPRSFTPDGTVGIGGQYLCIYGMDSPGGYQLVGRTVPIWNRWTEGKREKPWMFDVFDRIRFRVCDAAELDRARASGTGDHMVVVEEGVLDLEEYEAWLKKEGRKGEISVADRLQLLKTSGLFDELMKPYKPERSAGADAGIIEDINGELVKSDIAGRCWRCSVQEGDWVEKGQELVSHPDVATVLAIFRRVLTCIIIDKYRGDENGSQDPIAICWNMRQAIREDGGDVGGRLSSSGYPASLKFISFQTWGG